jgi:hypothetical protein
MDCKIVQSELCAGSQPSPPAKRHIETCKDCREFAADLAAIRTIREAPVVTPVLLRERTLDRCRGLLAEEQLKRRLTFGQRCRNILDSPRFVAATAVLSVLILVGLQALQIDENQDIETNYILKLSIIQVVVQNLAAALFLPLLLTFKRKLHAGSRLRQS